MLLHKKHSQAQTQSLIYRSISLFIIGSSEGTTLIITWSLSERLGGVENIRPSKGDEFSNHHSSVMTDMLAGQYQWLI